MHVLGTLWYWWFVSTKHVLLLRFLPHTQGHPHYTWHQQLRGAGTCAAQAAACNSSLLSSSVVPPIHNSTKHPGSPTSPKATTTPTAHLAVAPAGSHHQHWPGSSPSCSGWRCTRGWQSRPCGQHCRAVRGEGGEEEVGRWGGGGGGLRAGMTRRG